MQFVRTTTASALFVLLGTMDPACARAGQDKEKQDQHQAKGQQSGRGPAREQRPPGQQQGNRPPAQQQRQDQLSQQARQSQPMTRSEQQARTWQQQRGWARKGGLQGLSTWQQGRAHRWDTEHRSWLQRGGYGGYYIPRDRFNMSFGSRHYFRMEGRPNIYMGYPRFNYGGFSFLMVDPWPEYWGENWYQDDDVYIDYDDGYYLNNRRYPRVRLAITVVL